MAAMELGLRIMEDFCVHHNLIVISSDVPSKYLKLDYMLLALLAAKQKKKIESPRLVRHFFIRFRLLCIFFTREYSY